MASYNASINLLAFKQAQLLSGIDPNNPQRGYVCIPVDLNEIKVTGSATTTPLRAAVKVSMRPLHNPEALLAATNRTRQQRGDAPITLEDQHTHTLDVTYSVDFVKQAIKAFGQRLIDKVLAAQRTEYAEKIKSQDINDENSDLFKTVRRFMQPKLANMYLYRDQRASAPNTSPFSSTIGSAQTWTPPTVDDNGNPSAPADPFLASEEYAQSEDLPF